jgi:hypothetical protein
LLLTYDPLGELREVELTSEAEDYPRSALIDGSASVYFLSEIDLDGGFPPMQIESHAADGSLEWLIAESTEWTVGDGFSELTVIDLGEGVLDIAGFTSDFADSGSLLWRAKIDPNSGTLTRGCVHMVEDPDTQRLAVGASGPAGGLAIYGGQGSPDPLDPNGDGSHWVWMRYLGGYNRAARPLEHPRSPAIAFICAPEHRRSLKTEPPRAR